MWLRIITWVGTAVALIVAAVVGSSAWRFSDELRDELLVPPTLPPGEIVEITAASDDRVTLALTDAALLSGTWGLVTPASYGRISLVSDSTGTTITRNYQPVEGVPAIGEGTLDQVAYRGDPQSAIGAPYRNVEIPGELGPLPAWRISGTGSTWVVYVHGAGGRADGLRAAAVIREAGYPLLVISYRNDGRGPATDDGHATWGFEEWRDVESAVSYALAEGAENVFLMGNGLGGSAVLMTLQETRHIRSIAGIVLDSPVLDIATTEEIRRPEAGLIGSWGRTLSSWRFGVEWSRLDHVARARELRRPVLLLHGVRDEITPIERADAFAAEAPDMVDYHRFDEAGHGQPWNVSPRRYALLLTEFLAEHSPEPE